jgi:hypothetical protein
MTAKRKWRIAALAVVAAAACLFHAPLLRGLVRLLIVDQPTDDYDCICICSWGHYPSGDRCYDAAAESYRRKPTSRILVVAPISNRLEDLGAIPSFDSISRRELTARRVPQSAISIVYAKPWNDWAAAQAIAAWMSNHPGRRVLLLNAQFHSGQMRRAIDDVLEPDAAASLFVKALPDRDCDDTNWWRQRAGYRAFAESWLLRLQSRTDEDAKRPARSADDYERDFLRAFREGTP